MQEKTRIAQEQRNTIKANEFFRSMYWEEPIPAEKTAAIFEEKNKQAKELAALQEQNRKNATLG